MNKPFCFFSKVFKFKDPVPRNDKQIPPPSVLIPLSWKMRNWLNRIRKILRKILRFLFFELSWKIHHKLGWWRYKNDQKMTTTRKIKIGKIWNIFFFFRFSRFRIFHVNFINFEKKMILMLHDNTVAWLFWYAVYTNLFLLDSTNPKKNYQTLDAFRCGRRE